MLFDRQLSYYSNTTLIIVRNLTVLSSATDRINRVRNYFWDKWRHEYVINPCETQRISKANINPSKINVNDIVLVYNEKVPRRFCRIAIVAEGIT